MLRITKNYTKKSAAHHQTRNNNPAAEALRHAWLHRLLHGRENGQKSRAFISRPNPLKFERKNITGCWCNRYLGNFDIATKSAVARSSACSLVKL